MQTNIKTCPFCGEDIKSTALKCRFCGEWFDKSTNQSNKLPKETSHHMNYTDKINSLDINESWKKTFLAINKYNPTCSLNPFAYTQEFQNLSPQEGKQVISDIRGGISRTIILLLLGPIAYFLQGMWLKGIIYALGILVLSLTISQLLISFGIYAPEIHFSKNILFNIFLINLNPLDYYKHRVLGR